jgi:serine/threonine protein kinase
MVIDRFRLVGTCLEKKFQIDKFVTEGGFAAVYGGRHLVLERAVAIKVLKTPDEYNDAARENFISKFRLEAKIIARLSHPNIVQVIDFGVSKMPSGDEAPWMALEWLTGATLEHELEGRRGCGGRTPAETVALLQPVFDALAYAHDEGLAHRDVKPGNIMLVSSRQGWIPKLLDFGIVKVMDEGEAVEHSFMRTSGTLTSHTPGYAAPEQITGLRTGPWTDVHALGLLVTEALTDLPPYDGRDANTLLREVLSPQRPTPGRRRVDVGPWEPILTRALSLEPKERYKDASEFLAALRAAIPSVVPAVRTSVVPKTGSSAPVNNYAKTHIRDSQPTPEDLAALRSARVGRRPLVQALVAVATLAALVAGYFVFRKSPHPASASEPVATQVQPPLEQKVAPPPVAEPPPPTQVITAAASAPSGGETAQTAPEQRAAAGTSVASKESPEPPPAEVALPSPTEQPATIKRRPHPVRRTAARPKIELE